MEIQGLRYLVCVDEAGSFAAAARALNLHTSTLSRHVFAIEEELGTTIFEREHSGVRLTSSGREVLVYVRQALADLDALAKIGRSSGIGRRGRVRLGVQIPPIGRAIGDLLSRWHSFYSDVELSLYELPDSDLCKAARSRRLDAILIAEHAISPELVSEPMFCERLFAGVPIHSPFSSETSISLSDLAREIVLVQDWPQSHVTRAFYGELFGHATQFRTHAVSKQTILALVSAGYGITLATESQAAAGFRGVAFIPIADKNSTINVMLAWTPQSEDPAIGRFIAFMRDEARSLRSR
jgi:DNA-binding transcriptional LysR family regulator